MYSPNLFCDNIDIFVTFLFLLELCTTSAFLIPTKIQYVQHPRFWNANYFPKFFINLPLTVMLTPINFIVHLFRKYNITSHTCLYYTKYNLFTLT